MERNQLDIEPVRAIDEVAWIASMQKGGIVDVGAAEAAGFAQREDAILWARSQVEEAGGGLANAYFTSAKFQYFTEDGPRVAVFPMYLVRSEYTPVFGLVYGVDVTAEDFDDPLKHD